MAIRTGGPGALSLSFLVLPHLGQEDVSMRRMKTSGGTTSGTTYIDLEDVKVPIENTMGNLSTSSSPCYLTASTRSHSDDEEGYVTSFSLDAETGVIVEQLHLTESTGSGGNANSVSVATFNGEYFAITDSDSEFMEIWRINSTSAGPVAHLDLDGQPANVV
ncbi:hypothetical protein SEUCBS139899_002977 [Sporothrix eucalyptigena]